MGKPMEEENMSSMAENEKLRIRMRNVGSRIAYIRKIRGLNQDQLAELSGVSLSYLAKIEANSNDEPNLPSVKYLYRIADALNVPITKLFEEEIQ